MNACLTAGSNSRQTRGTGRCARVPARHQYRNALYTRPDGRNRKTLDPLIPKPGRRPNGRGRPWKSRRSVLNGVLWVLRTGAPWAESPDRYPSLQTWHRRFQQWVRSGVMTRIMTALAHELSVRGAIDVREAFTDASFAPRKKGTQSRKNEAWQGDEDRGGGRP